VRRRPNLCSACARLILILFLGSLAPTTVYGQGLIRHFLGHDEEDECYEILTVEDLAKLIDRLDKELYRYGKVAVKSPDIWGQNRMTRYRDDFEKEMSAELDNFKVVLNSYQRRSDAAALTSATTIGAAIQPGGAAGKAGTATTTTVQVPPTPPVIDPSSPLVQNANTLIGTVTRDLAPADIANLTIANNTGSGIGLEPTIVLDQKARYLNHLAELRRINAGDDSTDTAGYGLYLMRMPVSLLPGPQSQRGKGAVVTLEAKFEPTSDLLPLTFRNVIILDTTYQLKDFLLKALHKTIDLTKDPAPSSTPPEKAASRKDARRLTPNVAAPAPGLPGTPTRTAISSTEIIDVYGRMNLKKIADEIESDEKDWYRHDPSVVTWLLSELTTAHNFFRDEARRGNPLFLPPYIQRVGEYAFQRRYSDLKRERVKFLKEMIKARTGSDVTINDDDDPKFYDKVSALDVLTFGLLIQSYYLDRTIKVDMEVMARRRGCNCGDPWALILYEPYPSEEARAAFSAYVACKWPIHVFALDPAVAEQNQLDLFSLRSELQLALAVAVSTGSVNFNNATTYARRLETDLATVALNRTAVGFGAGERTFGWRFYPRVQTPPTQSNPARFLGLLLFNGPGPYYDLRHRQIEPGPRECVAMVVTPNFVPQIRLTSVSNWFDLAGHCCSEQTIETTDMVRMAHRLQKARAALHKLCDTHDYPPNQIALLSERLDQLEALLPMRTHEVALPFEGDLSASEIFTSTAAGLSPRLLTWYGEPPKVGAISSIFVVGTGFTVHELKTIAGGMELSDTDLISRNVLRINIPADARPITTNANLDGVSRVVFDVHVASPNGVSNHLLVEAQPGDQPQAPAPPQSAYTINAKTPVLNIDYNPKDASGKFKPSNPTVDPSTPTIQILWNDSTGIAPKQIQVSLNLHYKGGMITIPLGQAITLSGTNRGVYEIRSPGPLDQVATEYVEQLDSLDNFTLDNPLPTLTTDSIDITPVSDGKVLDAQTVQTNNQLTIVPTPIGAIPAGGAAPANPAVAPPPANAPAAAGAAGPAGAAVQPPAAAPAARPATNLAPITPPGSATRVRSRVLPQVEGALTQASARLNAQLPTARGLPIPASTSVPTIPGVPAITAIPAIPAFAAIPTIPAGATLPAQQLLQLSPLVVAPAPVTTSTTTVTPAAPATATPKKKRSFMSQHQNRPQ
jgi:hypothetical protein